jgi:hypothetical protein
MLHACIFLRCEGKRRDEWESQRAFVLVAPRGMMEEGCEQGLALNLIDWQENCR